MPDPSRTLAGSRYGMALAKLEVSYPSVSLDHIDAESFDRWMSRSWNILIRIPS
jgi:hypothetical protein